MYKKNCLFSLFKCLGLRYLKKMLLNLFRIVKYPKHFSFFKETTIPVDPI